MTGPRVATAGALWMEPRDDRAVAALTPVSLVDDGSGDLTFSDVGPAIAEARDWNGTGTYEVLMLTPHVHVVDDGGDFALDYTGTGAEVAAFVRDGSGDFTLTRLPATAGAVLARTTGGDAVLLPDDAPRAEFLRMTGDVVLLH